MSYWDTPSGREALAARAMDRAPVYQALREAGCACKVCGCDNASLRPLNVAGVCRSCEAGDHLPCDPDCAGQEPHVAPECGAIYVAGTWGGMDICRRAPGHQGGHAIRP